MTISKRTLGIAGAVLLVALIGGYFAFLGPKGTDVSLVVDHTAMSSTQTQTVNGTVAPAEAGRLVIVEVQRTGTWTEAARTTTDATGVYKAEFPMTEKGAQKVRVRVEKEGRQKAVTSNTTSVTVLNPTQLEATIAKFARTDKPLRVTGRVGPAAERTVIVEKSTDGQEWTTASEGTSVAASGQFTVAAIDFAAGQVQLRVRVEASTDAEAVSAPEVVSVEDYAAAGRRYLQIVEPTNKLLDKFNALTGTTNLTRAKELAKKMAPAYTREAKLFRRYAYWPKEIQPQVELIAKASILRADYYNLMSRVKNFSEYNDLDYESPKGSDNAPVLIRAALGLPKRS